MLALLTLLTFSHLSLNSVFASSLRKPTTFSVDDLAITGNNCHFRFFIYTSLFYNRMFWNTGILWFYKSTDDALAEAF